MTQLVLYASLFLYDKNGIFDDDKEDRLSVVRSALCFCPLGAKTLLSDKVQMNDVDPRDDFLLGRSGRLVPSDHHLLHVAVLDAVSVGIPHEVAIGRAPTSVGGPTCHGLECRTYPVQCDDTSHIYQGKY